MYQEKNLIATKVRKQKLNQFLQLNHSQLGKDSLIDINALNVSNQFFFENNNLLRRHQKRQHSGKDDAPLKIICHICNRSVQRDNIRQGFFGFLFTDHSGLLSIDLS